MAERRFIDTVLEKNQIGRLVKAFLFCECVSLHRIHTCRSTADRFNRIALIGEELSEDKRVGLFCNLLLDIALRDGAAHKSDFQLLFLKERLP